MSLKNPFHKSKSHFCKGSEFMRRFCQLPTGAVATPYAETSANRPTCRSTAA
jgi:hypothetical protein